jgi:polygalacturonase
VDGPSFRPGRLGDITLECHAGGRDDWRFSPGFRAGIIPKHYPYMVPIISRGRGKASVFRVASGSLMAALLLFSAPRLLAITAIFNVRDYGATGDGHTLETRAMNAAIDACAKSGGGTVYVPPGRYLTGTIQIKSHVTLDIDAGATVLGSENIDDYPAMENPWGKLDPRTDWISPLIYAVDAENIAVTGWGTIDGQGAIWWRRVELNDAKKFPPGPQNDAERADAALLSRGRPNLIRFLRCKDVVIEDVNIRNSPAWNIHPLLCEDVRVEGVTITNPPAQGHNTDGIDPESCRNVQILNCRIDTGDDGITLKSGLDAAGRAMARPCEDITIANCVVYHAHGGVTIGSEESGGVRNVTVANCVFQGTQNGIRIKAQRGRGGVVEGISVSNIVMQDVPTPFTITSFYMGRDKPEDVYPVDEGTPVFRDMLFSNITARGATNAGAITGLREQAVEDLTFSNVHIQAKKGFAITNAKDVVFLDSIIDTASGPAVMLRNAAGIDVTRLRTRAPHQDAPLVQDAGGMAQ